MKRFQPGLKREARPQRHGGGLQITNEKSSRLWGWRGEQAWTAEGHNKDTSNARLAVGGTLKLIPKERKQKRCDYSCCYQRCNAEQPCKWPESTQKVRQPWAKGDCEGSRLWGEELEKGSSTQWLEHKLGTQELPGVVFNFHSLILCILGFPFLFLSIMPSGARVKYVKTLIKIHKTTATENNVPWIIIKMPSTSGLSLEAGLIGKAELAPLWLPGLMPASPKSWTETLFPLPRKGSWQLLHRCRKRLIELVSWWYISNVWGYI